jgi:GT2 family glycosyltransferase
MHDDQPGVELTVVLVSYNSEHVIMGALSPLVDQAGIDVVVVDNDSKDSTVEEVRRQYPSVRVMELERNLGFAKAVNLAIESCSSSKVMLLNPDAVIEVDDVRELLSAFNDGTGIVAPLIDDPGNRLQVVPAGHFPTIWRMFLHFSGVSRLSGNKMGLQGHYLLPQNLDSQRMSVKWVTGACMLFTKETWRRAGGLSERWFMYAEDIDFCFRVKALGLSVDLIPGSAATHLVGKSDSTASFSANPAWIVNLHDFYVTRLSPSRMHSLSWCLVVGMGLFSRSVVFQVKGLTGTPRSEWRREASRFRVFAVAIVARVGTVFRRPVQS